MHSRRITWFALQRFLTLVQIIVYCFASKSEQDCCSAEAHVDLGRAAFIHVLIRYSPGMFRRLT